MKKIHILLIGLVGLVGGIAVDRMTRHTAQGNTSDSNIAVVQTYRFINPTVMSNLGKHFIINFKPLRDEFTKIQAKYNNTGDVYFVYLNNDVWVGLGERDLFFAASTVKVPLAMAIYKSVEEGRLKLDDRYSLEELDLDEQFGKLYQVGVDKELSIRELLSVMLEKSDNTAAQALAHITKKIGIEDPLFDIYQFMGWDTDPAATVRNYSNINLKTLSNMFLSLYNGRYISLEHANDILRMLDESEFNDKIVAGIPKGVPVSHKIGIADAQKAYTDCGIVYAPNRHYILCVATQSMDQAKASQFMAEISKTAYQYVIKH